MLLTQEKDEHEYSGFKVNNLEKRNHKKVEKEKQEKDENKVLFVEILGSENKQEKLSRVFSREFLSSQLSKPSLNHH